MNRVLRVENFPYNEFFDYSTHLRGKPERWCISKEHLQSVREAMSNVSFKRWRPTPLMSEWHPSHSGETVVLPESVGATIGYIVFQWPQGKGPTILAHALAEIPVVFPTRRDAILIAEAKLRGLPEAGIALWVPIVA
jgi:hypothetical protein